MWEKLNRIKQFISTTMPEILVLIGLFFIAITTFLVNFIAGMYLTGIILLVVGLYLAKERG